MSRIRTIVGLLLAMMCCSSLPLAADDSLSLREERAIQAAVDRVAPSVVRIETVGGLERVGRMLVGTGPTTGLVVSSDGYIISSAFNFAQQPDSILVTLPGGKRQAAKLVSTDHSRMLVLLKVEVDDELQPAEAVPQDEIRVGQWAIAVGRTYDVDETNTSVGIVSALNRIWNKAIQTDAKISPNNYGGPLVDIAGRVLGVLVPMSPQGTGDVAGVEWYDSGIGFAVPLENILRVLPRLIEGEDLRAGLLGIALKGDDLYSGAPELAAAAPTAPAYQAGFRAGDVIVEVGDKPVTRQAELKHALGPLYAGETVRIVARRGDERIEHELELVGRVEPYVAPYLGVLPLRNVPEGGLVVRAIDPDGPAAASELAPGDVISSFEGQAVKDRAALVEQLQARSPGETVVLNVQRGDETLAVTLELGSLPESLPGDLPAAHAAAPVDAPDERPQVGLVPIKLPEFENECQAYVPESYHPGAAYGLVVWLHAPGNQDAQEMLDRWKPLCEQHDLIFLAPKSLDATKWQPTEARFVRRAIDALMKTYNVDRTRIAAHGHQGGGVMAYLVGLANRDLVRAIAAVDAPLPRLSQLPMPEPGRLQAVYTTLASNAETTPQTEAGIKQLREAKYPVVVQEVGEQNRYLTEDELAALARWIDSLDRL